MLFLFLAMNFHISGNFSQIKGHLEHFLTSLALNVSCDVKDSILRKIIKIMNGYSAISGPYERDRDN
jgi:hypothetical protein